MGILNNTFGLEQNKDKLIKICHFLDFDIPKLDSDNIICATKEICVKKLCEVVGLKCGCNFRNPYFNFFGCVMGQAVCEKLKINLTIAPAGLRLIKYDGINFITKALEYLNSSDIEEAFIDVFDLTDDHKDVINMVEWD